MALRTIIPLSILGRIIPPQLSGRSYLRGSQNGHTPFTLKTVIPPWLLRLSSSYSYQGSHTPPIAHRAITFPYNFAISPIAPQLASSHPPITMLYLHSSKGNCPSIVLRLVNRPLLPASYSLVRRTPRGGSLLAPIYVMGLGANRFSQSLRFHRGARSASRSPSRISLSRASGQDIMIMCGI